MLPADDPPALRPMQINDLYAYQVAFGARLVLEGPYVPSFATDIAGGPPGLGVCSPASCCRLAAMPDAATLHRLIKWQQRFAARSGRPATPRRKRHCTKQPCAKPTETGLPQPMHAE